MLSEERNLQTEMAGTDRACMMLVRINGHENDMPYGIIVNYHLPRSVSFGGIHGLILTLDEVCEIMNVPMAATELRFLQKEREQQYRASRGKRQEGSGKALEKEEVAGNLYPYVTAAREVILIHMLFRQNSSMQGRFRCNYTGTHYIASRSALELMRMLEETNTYMCQKRINKNLKM